MAEQHPARSDAGDVVPARRGCMSFMPSMRLGADIEDGGEAPWNRGTFGPWGSSAAGSMGSGIVEVLHGVGLEVVFSEPTEELVATGRARIEASTRAAVERGKLTTADQHEPSLTRVRGATGVEVFE